MENDIGIKIWYTVLAMSEEDGNDYIIYTNYLPSDNELGVRLFAGLILDKDNFKIEKVSKTKEKKLIDDFILEMITTGKKIKRVK